MLFLHSLVIIWRTQIPALRCGGVVISLISSAAQLGGRLDLAPGAPFMIAS